ncbi:hypothetical protein SAY87_017883 [Trapa incisa]|uniref:Uncharacterized protein n=1 Tax=Trapa incisa TaxID=236973 RepID=A0AAN7LAS0_9MYRT|nr:hypothetical protein SAY87_017883 [Trapa incisa]
MDPRFHGLFVDDFNFGCHSPSLSNVTSGFISCDSALDAVSYEADPFFSIEPDTGSSMSVISTDDLEEEFLIPDESDVFSALNPSLSKGTSSHAGVESPSSDVTDSSDPILKYINQMLMEENMEEEVWISPDDLALRNTEKSLYDAIGEQYPDQPSEFQNFDANQFVWHPDSSLSMSGVDPNWIHDPGKGSPRDITPAVHPLDQDLPLNLHCRSAYNDSSKSDSIGKQSRLGKSNLQVKTTFDDNYTVMQFMKGLEEASKFLPPSNQLLINFENVCTGSQCGRGTTADMNGCNNDGNDVKAPGGFNFRGKKKHDRNDFRLVEPRTSLGKAEEDELLNMFDRLLLCTDKVEPPRPTSSTLPVDATKELQSGAPLSGCDSGRGLGRIQDDDASVDLRALLIQCAQALSSNDLRTANELLKKIRENSSPSGDGSQRLAHYFSNGLEARMVGNRQGPENLYATVTSKKRSVADLLKTHQLHISSCPMMRLSVFYMNYMIWKLSQKFTALHVIDFGIGFGFKWPLLIQKLGEQPGGPPKLRITGIELPGPGFRLEETVEETGHLLARYCDRFKVPFEYNVLPSKNWESIVIEDLKIREGEMIAVNCFIKFTNILDETSEEDSPRDVVLNLIRRIKPDIFVHMVPNGSYSMPFFVTRFREALFYMSSIYDMLETTMPREHKDSKERTMLESEFYSWGVINAIACEGPERIQRPETYKQWQVRHERAGFKQLPLDQLMMKEIQHMLRSWYHKDFLLDDDGDWMLFGWKGRITDAITCLVPV